MHIVLQSGLIDVSGVILVLTFCVCLILQLEVRSYMVTSIYLFVTYAQIMLDIQYLL